MTKNTEVSLSVVRRLPRYYRFLGELSRAGVERISSSKLSDMMGLTASQIRQDLNCFGGFGQQGYGYNVQFLREEISKIMGLQNRFEAILIGAGNLGRAMLGYIGFRGEGFRLTGVFDKNPMIVGEVVSGLVVQHIDTLEAFCLERHPDVAVLCIPKSATGELAPRLIELGIHGFWNFSHYDLALNHPGVIVENVHLNDSLMTLCYRVNDLLDGKKSSDTFKHSKFVDNG
ncbi:MAG TPA: redox-sensing transcriptional repressor Rex [Firmicutes bacterium]|nr:redox-sensing transcriptional repressor Rex [Bacillota bacterium]